MRVKLDGFYVDGLKGEPQVGDTVAVLVRAVVGSVSAEVVDVTSMGHRSHNPDVVLGDVTVELVLRKAEVIS